MARPSHRDPMIGERIKARRLLRGWSIRYAASRAGIHDTTWGRIERGEVSADNRFTLVDIAAALEVATIELTGIPTPGADDPLHAARVHLHPVRQALVEADLGDPPMCDAPPAETLSTEVALVRDLRVRCDLTGLGQRLPTLIRQLHAAAHGPDRGAALPLVVDAAESAMTYLMSLGQVAEGWLAAERAQQAAELLDEPVMLGFARWCRAHAVAACGSYPRAAALATRAAEEMDRHTDAAGSLEMLGMLHLTCAQTAYGSHEPQAAADRLTAAEELAGRTGETDTLSLFFGPTNVRFWKVSLEADAGDPGRAVEIARDTIPTRVPSPLRQSGFHAATARALARLNRDEEAVRHLLTAERIAPERIRASTTVRETARGLIERARRAAGGAELRGFCERLSLPL